MKNVILILLPLFLGGCLGSGSSSSSSAPAPATQAPAAGLANVLAAAGCTVAQDGNNVTLSCNGTSATIMAVQGAQGQAGVGTQGPAGSAGIAGPAGVAGGVGPAGVQGIQGVPGVAGSFKLKDALGTVVGDMFIGSFTVNWTPDYSSTCVWNNANSVIVCYTTNGFSGFPGTYGWVGTGSIVSVPTVYYPTSNCQGQAYVSTTEYLPPFGNVLIYAPSVSSGEAFLTSHVEGNVGYAGYTDSNGACVNAQAIPLPTLNLAYAVRDTGPMSSYVSKGVALTFTPPLTVSP
jgi:hypothetical protein